MKPMPLSSHFDHGVVRAAGSCGCVMQPGPTLRARPCLIEFSTSGCRIMLGTIDVQGLARRCASRPAGAGPKRTTSMSRYSSIDSSSSRSVTKWSLAAHQAPQQARELHDQHAGGVRLGADQRGDRGQRVEQEVRVDLAGERLDLRRQQQLFLFLQPVLDARAVPDLDRRGARRSTVAEHDRRPASSTGEVELRKNTRCAPEAGAERLTQQLQADRRQQQDDLPVVPEPPQHPPRCVRQVGEDERREVPDRFLRADLAQAAAREAAADGEGQGDELARRRGRAAPIRQPTRAPAYGPAIRPARKAPSSVRSAAL